MKMEMIIELDNNIVENMCLTGVCKGDPKKVVRFYQASIADAIVNGTPLPKGHGRLIEEPTETDISNTIGGNNDFAECIRDSVKAVFDNATTVIEADKSEKGDVG